MVKWTRHLLQSYSHHLPTAFEDYGPYAACIGVETTDSAGQGAQKLHWWVNVILDVKQKFNNTDFKMNFMRWQGYEQSD